MKKSLALVFALSVCGLSVLADENCTKECHKNDTSVVVSSAPAPADASVETTTVVVTEEVKPKSDEQAAK